ncbi:MAG: hypothetical protein AABW83_04375 [Nanoarchaeota archaeon]
MRIKFQKGKQKQFIENCIKNLNCISLKALLQFGIKTNYNNLKNYHNERRLIPEELFKDLIHLSKININNLETEIKNSNWGQIKGGKTKKRLKRKNLYIDRY